MAVHLPLLKGRLAPISHSLRCGIIRPQVHVRSVHVAESGPRTDEELAWDAGTFLPFSRAKIGTFFQERPVLKNPFLEDALLRGYLRRHLPKQVKKKKAFTLYTYDASFVHLIQ